MTFYVYSSLLLQFFLNILLFAGAASVSKGFSLYLDRALNGTMENWYINNLPIHNVSFLSEYFDIVAFTVPVLLSRKYSSHTAYAVYFI